MKRLLGPPKGYKIGSRRSRYGVSPVIATTIIIAITVVMGLALYAFASSQTNVATAAYSQEVTDYINLRNDRFVISTIDFNRTSINDKEFKAFVFNNGDRVLRVGDAILSDGSSVKYSFCPPDSIDDKTLQPKELKGIVFSAQACDPSFLGFATNPDPPVVYEVKIFSSYGSSETYFQKYGIMS